MTSNALVRISSLDERDIDRDRIVNGDLVPDEYFCPICQYLLWKPRSCSSCQHLFCEKCIRTWIGNPVSANRCPFRCEPFEERQCPPYIQSLLSHLNIYCRNSGFGCTQILSYDQLEYHETVYCQYLTQRCVECDQLVLLSKLDEHRQIPGLCVSRPIKCTICEIYIEKSLFQGHFYRCRLIRLDQLNRIASFNQNLQRRLNNQPVTQNNELRIFETIANNLQLIEQQRQMARIPLTLKGIDAVQQAREQNCGHLFHILIMLEFFLINWSKIPYFLLTKAYGGLLGIIWITPDICIHYSKWIKQHIYCGSLFLILLSCLLTYLSSIVIQSTSDGIIIFCFTTIIFILGCLPRLPLEVYESDLLFNKPIFNIILCCLSLFIMKIILLLIHLYYWFIPSYITISLIGFFHLCLTLKVYRSYRTELPTTTMNRRRMPA